MEAAPHLTDAQPGKPYFSRFIGRNDIDQMPDTPHRGSHRRAQSETFFRLPTEDDFLFDPDNDFSLPDFQPIPPDPLDNASSFINSATKSQESNTQDSSLPRASGNSTGHFRSLSVDTAFFDNLGFQDAGGAAADGPVDKVGDGGKRMHRHSNSMDRSSPSSSLEVDSMSSDYTKKSMAADKLAELALIDPRRAKRILANRQSAARSKERKIRYTGELERKVQTLQTEATTLSAQLTLLQRDTTGLTSENKELKLRLQAMEQQAHLRDALNEALREEVQRLKIATGQIHSVNGNSFTRGLQQSIPSFFPQQIHHMSGHQTQQHHVAQSSPNGPPMAGQSPHGPNSIDFNRGSNNNI